MAYYITVNWEHAPATWWAAARHSGAIPAAARGLIHGKVHGVRVTNRQALRIVNWASSLPGFADGPDQAPTALVVTDCNR